MSTPKNKRTLKLQQQINPSQERFSSFNTNKKQHNLLSPITHHNQRINKLSNEGINIPKPKRAQKQEQNIYGSEKNLLIGEKLVSKIVHGLQQKRPLNKKDKEEKLIKGQQKNNSSNNKSSPSLYTKSDNLGEILSFYLCEDSVHRGSQLQLPMRTVYEWQNEEINRLVGDPNLGDFLIKLPNPDHLQEKYIRRYYKYDKDNADSVKQKQCRVQYQQAIICYNDMFNTEGVQKSRRERELTCFTIAYYLLSAESILQRSKMFIIENYQQQNINYQQQQNQQQQNIDSNRVNNQQRQKSSTDEYFNKVDSEIQMFLIVFQYYRKIEHLGLEQLGLIKRLMQEDLAKVLNVEKNILILQAINPQKIPHTSTLNIQFIEHQYYKRTITSQEQLNKHKKVILQKFLTPFVLNLFQTLSIQPLGYDHQLRQAKSKYFFFQLAQNINKTSLLFTYFAPFASELFMNYVNREFNKYGSKRRLVNGGLLQKKISGENILWVNNKNKPRDLFTLLRNCLVYKLTQRCLFRVRTFLSKNQRQLMIVVKSSEEVLQYYAQKNQIPMEIQIGSTDIFSFQPVDKYNRPLRLHNYLRDEEFIKKYSLKSNKIDKDQQSQSKSLESQALNIFKKAQKMNPDQLRAKSILDQQDCDQAFRWISCKLNCPFINEPNILVNEKNNEQIDRQTWECYYVYNKLIIAFVNRIRKMLQAQSKSVENDRFVQQVTNNLGLILRLMFVKAITMVNDFYYENRQNRSVIPNNVQNIYTSKRKLKNLWDRLSIRQPTGYSQYIKNKYFQKIWRKYQVNQIKQRSKFFPAERLNIANKIINKHININRSIQKQFVIAYYPLHDPFILKGIKIEPYLLSLKRKIPQNNEKKEKADSVQNQVFNIYSLYQSKYTASDFTKLSISQKLSVKNSIFRHFSVETVRFYCGQKIGFYFQFTRYLTKQSFWYIIPCFLIQIFLWIQQTQILRKGETNLGYFNDALVFILTILNMFWTTNTVERWKVQQKNLAQRFGVSNLSEKDQKRVTFVGSYKRNFQTDDMNYEYVSNWVTSIKIAFGLVVNLLYVVLVSLVIIQIFVLKSILFQKGFSQSTVNAVPSILIALAVQIFNYLYIFLIKLITSFQNHKTISSFENSLISKSYTITFVVTFFSIFIYAFFSPYLDADYLCIIKTTETKEIIYDCSYFVSSQLLSFVMIDLALTIISGIWPYMKFKIKQFLQSRKQKSRTKFYYNKFQAIDEFYQQQDKMQSLMFTSQIDNTWLGFINLINVFTALALFGPALPLLYVMMFISGLVRLHASKYELIYLAKRSIPVKSRSINLWLKVIEVVSVISIITNIGICITIQFQVKIFNYQQAYMIFTRKIFPQNQTEIFFFFLISFLILKFYLLNQYSTRSDIMAQRNKKRVQQVLFKNTLLQSNKNQNMINTDIINVFYDENLLKRQLPKIKKANIQLNSNKNKNKQNKNNPYVPIQ